MLTNLKVSKALAITSLVIFVIDLFFNVTSMFPGPILNTFFNGQLLTTSSTFVPSSILPDSWVFYIWSLIYAYQLSWIVVAIVYAFSKHAIIVPAGSYIGFIFASVFNFIWLITYSFNQIVTSFIVMFLLFLSIGFASYWSAICLCRNKREEITRKVKRYLHIFLSNGLFLYFTWIIVAMHLNLDNLFVNSGIPKDTSAGIVLGLLLAFQIAIFVLDVTVLRKIMKKVVVVYPVIIFAMIAIITEVTTPFYLKATQIVGLVIVNLIVAVALFLVKSYFYIRYRHCHDKEVSVCRSKA